MREVELLVGKWLTNCKTRDDRQPRLAYMSCSYTTLANMGLDVQINKKLMDAYKVIYRRKFLELIAIFRF